jgi:hypothetical protein
MLRKKKLEMPPVKRRSMKLDRARPWQAPDAGRRENGTARRTEWALEPSVKVASDLYASCS